MKKLIALGVVAAVIAAFKFLPWWAGVGLVVGLVLGAKWLVKTLFGRFFMGLFEMKSQVLRGASARVHGISEAPEPKRDLDDLDAEDLDDADELEATPRAWRYVDVTIEVPGSPDGGAPIEPAILSDDEVEEDEEGADECGMHYWEPEELMIVRPDAKPGKAGLLDDDDDEIGEVDSADIWQDGAWVPLEGQKVRGTQRVRLHVGVEPGCDAFKLRYYFEILKNAG